MLKKYEKLNKANNNNLRILLLGTIIAIPTDYNSSNNKSSILPHVGSGNGSVYTDLTLPSEDREATYPPIMYDKSLATQKTTLEQYIMDIQRFHYAFNSINVSQ